MYLTNMDFGLDESVQMLREAVRDFAQQEIAPLAASIDHDNSFPRALWPQMGQLGLFGITVPEQFGGSDLGYLAQVVAMEELSRASASIGLSFGAHANLCINQIVLHGSDEQKERFLPHLVSGEYLGALAMSDANAGSDVMAMSLSAVEEGDHFRLNGTKMWITNGTEADVVLVYAREVNNAKDDEASQALSAFIVERGTPGFSSAQKLDKLGMRGSDTCELVFDNCLISKENRIGSAGDGARILMSGLDIERVVLAAGPLGIMASCLDTVLPYLHERKQFGRAIGQFQLVQGKLADMYTRSNAARAYVYAVANAFDRNQGCGKDAAGVILLSAELATQLALDAIQLLGGNGYINEYPTGRLLRDAKLYEIGAGTSEIRRWLIGRKLFEESQ